MASLFYFCSEVLKDSHIPFIIIMEKYKYNTVADFLEALNMTREDIKEMIAKSTIHLSTNCEKNFDGSPEVTEEVAQPFYYLLEIIDNVA